jgi:hypothetical protein
MIAKNPETERETEIYRRNYDTALSELLSEIWGGHLHMGLFESAGDSLLGAQIRVNRSLAAPRSSEAPENMCWKLPAVSAAQHAVWCTTSRFA